MLIQGKTVLVTGGAGLIGSHIVDILVSEYNCKVKVIDNLDPDTHPYGKPDWLNPNVEYIWGDMSCKADVEKALDGVQLVWHQAAAGGFTGSYYKYMNSNVSGTALIYDIIREKKLPVEKIVAASSQAVYGECTYGNEDGTVFHPKTYRSVERLSAGKWEVEMEKNPGKDAPVVPIAEECDCDCHSAYAISKHTEERMTISFGKANNIPSVALRYAVTFGPRQSIHNPYTGIISIFSVQILNGASAKIYEDGYQTRDFIFVEDVARANIKVMESDDANYQVFNVSNCKGVKIMDVYKNLAEFWGKPELQPTMRGDFRPWDCRHLILDNSKLRKLGWEPKVPVFEGMKKQVEWVKECAKKLKEQGGNLVNFDDHEAILRQLGIVKSAK